MMRRRSDLAPVDPQPWASLLPTDSFYSRLARDGWYRPVKLFRFPREACEECELRARCLGGPTGRTKHPVRQPPGRQVQLHYHEEELQKARGSQRTPEQRRALREKLRPRAKVERKIAELVRPHGLRQGRYFGEDRLAGGVYGDDGKRQAVIHLERGGYEAHEEAAEGSGCLRGADRTIETSGNQPTRPTRSRLNQRLPNPPYSPRTTVLLWPLH
jgi:hypothetical protein